MAKIIKNLLPIGNPQNFGGVMVDGGAVYTIPSDELETFKKSDKLINALTSEPPTASIFSDIDSTELFGASAVDFLKDINNSTTINAFASKILDSGKGLFKRVHGVKSDIAIPANTIGYIYLAIPYAACKFSGAEILNIGLGDYLEFYILDTDTNTYSQAPVETYGANFPLNQFGFSVYMPEGSIYKNTSNYDADLFQGMELMCVYKNNSASAKTIYMNAELHEVK